MVAGSTLGAAKLCGNITNLEGSILQLDYYFTCMLTSKSNNCLLTSVYAQKEKLKGWEGNIQRYNAWAEVAYDMREYYRYYYEPDWAVHRILDL